MIIHIPSSQHGQVRAFLGMPESERAALPDAFRSAPTPTSVTEFVSFLATKGVKVGTEVVGAFVSMRLTMQHQKVTAAEFAPAVMKEAMRLRLGPKDAGEEFWKTAAGQLADLLACDHSLGVLAKAIDVLSLRERSFTSARIASDIRPVFGQEIREKPDVVLVLHTLRIEHTGQADDFFVLLTRRDLKTLQSTIERALAKTLVFEADDEP